jgi:hypothetical protein
MFYFLEALDAPPLCRPCLVQASRSQPSPLPPSARVGPASPVDRAPTISSGQPLLADSPVDTAIRIYLREELERARLTLVHVPDADPRVQSMRRSYQEAFDELSSGRLLDAIITVRDLREAMAGFEGSGGATPVVPGPTPSGPTGPAPGLTDAASKPAGEPKLRPGPSSGETTP